MVFGIFHIADRVWYFWANCPIPIGRPLYRPSGWRLGITPDRHLEILLPRSPLHPVIQLMHHFRCRYRPRAIDTWSSLQDQVVLMRHTVIVQYVSEANTQF